MKRGTHVRFDEKLHAELVRLAERQDRTINYIVNEAARQYVQSALRPARKGKK